MVIPIKNKKLATMMIKKQQALSASERVDAYQLKYHI